MTLLLIGLGYFIKRGFDNKSKKIEINHTIYQQNRITAVNKFYENYAKAELMWNQIAIYDILSRKLSAKEIDKIIFPILNELDKDLLELRIYFTVKQHQYFNDLVENILSINGKLSNLYFDYNQDLTDTVKAIEFDFFKTDTLKKNNEILDKISQIIRETYKS